MFPHTITLYNVETKVSPTTCTDETTNHITILKGVLLDETKSITIRRGLNARENGFVAADAITLYIPFGVTAIDPASGEEKTFLPAADFWRTENKTPFWTLSAGKQRSGPASGTSFFLRGEAVHPELDVGELETLYAGNAFTVSTVSTMNFGGLPHWEIGAN